MWKCLGPTIFSYVSPRSSVTMKKMVREKIATAFNPLKSNIENEMKVAWERQIGFVAYNATYDPSYILLRKHFLCFLVDVPNESSW